MMNDTEKTRILARVAKMLRLANDAGASEGERDNAMRMAHATLAKYNLDLAQVEVNTGKQNTTEQRVKESTTFYGRPWARQMANSIAELFFCTYVYIPNKKATSVGHYFIGRHSNAVTAASIAEFIVNSTIREGRSKARQQYEGNAFIRSFCWGATHRVRERVRQIIADSMNQKSEVAATGTALVLASLYQREAEANKQAVVAMFGKLRTPSGDGSKKSIETMAYHSGREYGSRVVLNARITR